MPTGLKRRAAQVWPLPPRRSESMKRWSFSSVTACALARAIHCLRQVLDLPLDPVDDADIHGMVTSAF